MERQSSEMAGLLLSRFRSMWVINALIIQMIVYLGLLSQGKISGFGLLKISGGITMFSAVGMALFRVFARSRSEKNAITFHSSVEYLRDVSGQAFSNSPSPARNGSSAVLAAHGDTLCDARNENVAVDLHDQGASAKSGGGALWPSASVASAGYLGAKGSSPVDNSSRPSAAGVRPAGHGVTRKSQLRQPFGGFIPVTNAISINLKDDMA
ncbi:hypothetical protein SUGI_1179170 [Cryptomeria japonica]|nr:hypothetical protein SUGI_1179170 [Cryptomeria japonica]